MAEPKLLISDEDWAEIQKIAIDRGTRGQTILREAVLGWLHGRKIHALPVARQANENVLSSLLTIRSGARALAEQLDGLIESLGGRLADASGADANAGAALERATADMDSATEEINRATDASAGSTAKIARPNRKRPANRR